MSSNKKTYDKDNENNDDIINITEIKKIMKNIIHIIK